jgi:hypothetical protein
LLKFVEAKSKKCTRSSERIIVGIDAHGLKIQGRGYLMFFAKIPRIVKAFRKKCPGGGPPISGFIAFLLTSVLKFD